MHRPNTRSVQQKSESLLNTSSNLGQGRGNVSTRTRAPNSKGTAPKVSVGSVGTGSDTSIRGVRSSPVSELLDTCGQADSEAGTVGEPSDILRSSSQDRGLVDNQRDLGNRREMATQKDTSGAGPSSAASREVDSMQTLMSYLEDAMRATREEFRQELNALREAVGVRSNNGIVSPTPTNTQDNSSSNMLSTFHTRLKDWKVSYSGEGNVNDFLFKIDTLAERSQCPFSHLMASFHMFLTEKAEVWYWTFIKQNPGASYTSLKAALIDEFGSLETESEILLKISTRKQLARENYDDFHAYIVQMNLRLRNPMSDSSLIEIVKKNVNPDLRIMLFISEPKNLGELRLLAKRAERILQESKIPTKPLVKTRRVDEISVEGTTLESDEEQDPQIEALKIHRPYTKGDYSRIKCWNCLEMGHSYIYCPDETRRIFCFKCGKRDVTTPRCTEAHSENKRRSEQRSGDVRSTK